MEERREEDKGRGGERMNGEMERRYRAGGVAG